MATAMKQLQEEFGAKTVTGVSPLLLGNCTQLSDLSTRALVRLSTVARCRMVYEGETIFAQKARAGRVYLLLDGTIELSRMDASGQKDSYEVIAAYATFGDVVLLGEGRRRYTATAKQDSLIVEVPLQPLQVELESNPPQALAWRGSIMARLHRKEPGQVDTFGWRILGKLSEMFPAA